MREAAASVDRGRGIHRKDVSATGTPEVKATTSAGVEAVMGAPAKFKANAMDVRMKGLRSFEIDRVGITPDTAKAILAPLMLCIPHLVQIDGSFMRMWKECECGDH